MENLELETLKTKLAEIEATLYNALQERALAIGINEDLHNKLEVAKYALLRIEDPTSAMHPGRTISFADFELRAIAREALEVLK